MNISNTGLALIKKFEGLRTTSYQCSANVWTIGYGHTAGVKKGQTCTVAQAEAWLKQDVATAEKAVSSYASYKWNQNEFDALTSFTFNCGSGNLKALTASGTRSKAVIADKLLLYNKAAGVTIQGLVNRRKEERALFVKAAGSTSSGNTSTDTTVTNQATTEYFQKWLNSSYGAGLTVDGKYGTLTKTGAVKGLQKELNTQNGAKLTVDGKWGAKTKAACVIVKKGASGNMTRIIQGVLIGNGYKPGNIDGSFGSGTELAVKAYQKAKGLTADGIVGAKTFAKMLG